MEEDFAAEEIERLAEISELELTSPGEEFVERIQRMYRAGSTKNAIAKELSLDRAYVNEVLDEFIDKRRFNGHDFRPDFTFVQGSRIRVELGDSANTSIYVEPDADIESVKKKWMKAINRKID